MGRTKKKSSIETSPKKPLLSTERSRKHRILTISKTFDNFNNLNVNSMLKIHDFCKNCTYLFPEEIQLLHWVQETATVYSTVVI